MKDTLYYPTGHTAYHHVGAVIDDSRTLAAVASESRNRTLLVVGGLAVVGVGAFLVFRRKRR